MICASCARAGDAQLRGRKPDVVAHHHEECESPGTCTCQHRVAVPVSDHEPVTAGDSREVPYVPGEGPRSR